MLRLKNKTNILIHHFGIFAVFRQSQQSFKVEFVSEGFNSLMEQEQTTTFNKLRNKSLRQLTTTGSISYASFEQLERSFNKVLETGKTDVLESGKDLSIDRLNFKIKGENLNEGFDVVNFIYEADSQSGRYIVHRLIPKAHISTHKSLLEKRALKKQLRKINYFKTKYFNHSEIPIVLVDLDGKVFECNNAFDEVFMRDDLQGKLNIKLLVTNPEDRLLLTRTLKEIMYLRESKLKIKLHPDTVYELSFSLVLGINYKPLVSILFEESAYIAQLEKKSMEKGYLMETIGIMLNMFQKDMSPKKLINEGMQYINAIIEPDITQSYDFDAKSNAFNLLLEQCSKEYIIRILELKHPFNELVEFLVNTYNPMRPKLLHADTTKNVTLRNLMQSADLKTILIIPTIKAEIRLGISFFGFMNRKENVNLEKVGHYTSLVDILMHEVLHRLNLKILVRQNEARKPTFTNI